MSNLSSHAFWKAAYDLASNEFPILEMKSPALSKDSVWIVFRPRDIPTMPKRLSVELKGQIGHVDLSFADSRDLAGRQAAAHWAFHADP